MSMSANSMSATSMSVRDLIWDASWRGSCRYKYLVAEAFEALDPVAEVVSPLSRMVYLQVAECVGPEALKKHAQRK